MAKQRYDWEAIEKDFRTGRFSLQQLSHRHGPNKATISRRAAEEGWQKDLTGAVQQRTREKLSRPASEPPDLPDADIIEMAATENATIVQGHREMLVRWRSIASSFAQRLSEQVAAGKRTIEVAGDKTQEVDVDLEYVGKCMGYGTQAVERIVKLERQSYGLDLDGEDDAPPERELTDDEIDARIAKLQGADE